MYKPNQRQVGVEVLAEAGWVTGTMHVPAKTALVSYLNRKAAFVPMTCVPLDDGEPSLDFLAMRRDAMVVVVPDAADVEQHVADPPGRYEHARLRCLLGDSSVEGTVQLLGGLRVSDYLETNPGFMLLSACTLAMGSEPKRDVSYAIVNTGHVLAVADLSRTGQVAATHLEPVTADTR